MNRRGFLGFLAAAPIAAPAIAASPASARMATLRLAAGTAALGAKLDWAADQIRAGCDPVVTRAADGGLTLAFSPRSPSQPPEQDPAMPDVTLPLVTRSAVEDVGVLLRAESFDESANTIEVVWTTGATVRRYDWWSDRAIDEQLIVEPGAVRLDRLNTGAPFLDAHDSWSCGSVIGAVVRGTARVGKGEGTATIKLSRAPSHADLVTNIRDGIIQNVSVGYRIHAVEKIERDDGTAPLWKVTDWEPLEISAVPVGADPGAGMRSQPRNGTQAARWPVRFVGPAEAPSAAATRMRMRAAELAALRES